MINGLPTDMEGWHDHLAEYFEEDPEEADYMESTVYDHAIQTLSETVNKLIKEHNNEKV